MIPEQWDRFSERIMRKEGQKNPVRGGAADGDRVEWEDEGRNEDSEQTLETAARQGGWGDKGISALTGAGTEVGAEGNDGRE